MLPLRHLHGCVVLGDWVYPLQEIISFLLVSVVRLSDGADTWLSHQRMGEKEKLLLRRIVSLLLKNDGHATPELGKPTWSRHLRPDNSHLSILLQCHIELIGDLVTWINRSCMLSMAYQSSCSKNEPLHRLPP